MSRFRFTIESTLDDLFVISLVLRGVCDRLGMNAADASSVDISATEAVTNVIKHAYLGTEGREVTVEVSYTPERLDLFVRDEGKSMPDEQAAKLQRGCSVLDFNPTDLAAVPEGGMGLQIIYKLMDEAVYKVDGGTNCLQLTKFVRT